MFRVLNASLLLLFFLLPVTCGGHSPGQISSVSVSPDDKFIAVDFVKGSTSFIYKFAVDTGNATRLTDAKTGEESSPAISAGGKRIAYSYSPGKGAHSKIVFGNVDGSDLHPWSPSEANDFWPVFSPDNKTIIFARSGYYGSYSPIAQPYHRAWNFYASGLDGTNVRQLTNESFYLASPASVSSDGKRMVVVTEGVDTPRQFAVYSLDHSEKPALPLRPHVPGEASHDPILDYPNYMPDGKSIPFLAARDGKRGYGYNVYRLDLRTGGPERLTKGNGFASNLRVFTDGKTAVFLKWRSDWHGTPVKSELYLIDLQTHKLTPLKVNGVN